MNELPDPQDGTDRSEQEPTGTPEPEDFTPERVLEFLAEDAMSPGLRACATARMKQNG